MRAAAVEPGADATRLAVAGPDGPEPVAVLPSGSTVATALDELVGPSRGPVAVVTPPGGDAGDVAGDLAGDVRSVPAPVAVLAGRPGRFLVVDAGRSGTTLAVVEDGIVRSSVRVPVGGDRLDALLTAATGCPADRVRRVREALSFVDRIDVPGHGPLDAAAAGAALRPAFDDVVAPAAALAAGVGEVVLCGGVARTPLLAEMLDERVDRPVRVPAEPDLAAVRGALAVLGPQATGPVAPAPGGPDHRHPDRPPRGRHGRLLPAAAALGLLLVGTGTALGAAGGPPAPPPRTLVQYGYAVALPSGWEHTGGDPRHRRTLLTRTASPDGLELVSVERSPLGYDTAAEPDRARAELAAVHAVSGGVGELRPDTVDGRGVTRYRQQAGPDAVVDWYVLFDGTDELVVGCRRPARGAAPDTDRACAEVVGSVRPHD